MNKTASTAATGPDIALQVNIQDKTFHQSGHQPLQAVDQLAFTLPAHSFSCIVGPSGCGKTTTLRMILNLDKQFQGSIKQHVEGHVAAVFQEPRLLPWRTVEQNIRLVIPQGIAEAELNALLTSLGLQEVRLLYPGQLSLGLARRVSLARAFVTKPGLLVLDEPFVSLDDANARRLRLLLLDLWNARPTTALMVTHNLFEAAQLADQVLVFSERPTSLIDIVHIDEPQGARDEALQRSVVHQIETLITSR